MIAHASAETETSAIVRYAYADYTAGNVEAVRSLVAADARLISHAPRDAITPFGGEWIGLDGLDQFLAALQGAYEHKVYRVKSMVEHGSWVVVFLYVETIHRESGARVCTDFVEILRTRDSKIVEFQQHIDLDELYSAISAARGAANDGG